MATVETVKGPIEATELGRTLMHEHVFIRNPELEQNYPGEWDDEVMHVAALERMQALAAAGIETLVDLTVMGLGRSISPIQRLAAESPVNIVVATGFYTQRDLPTYFMTNRPGGFVDRPDPLIEMFIGDIRDGIAGSGVKAAVIKVSSDRFGITEDVGRVFAAAAEAHRETGLPIMTHSNPHVEGGLDQQQRFRDLGVDLRSVVIGHCGDTNDLDYLRRILDAGSSIGLDRFGMTITGVDAERIETLYQLIRLGYAEQLVVSHDASLYSVNMPPTQKDRLMPDWTHLIVSEQVLPELRRRGVDEGTIDQIMVRNPARILAGGAAAGR